MNRRTCLTVCATAIVCAAVYFSGIGRAASAQEAVKTVRPVRPSELIGEWKVDLRSKPGDKPYYQMMVIEAVDGNGVKGKFYNSEIRDGRVNVDWGTLHFAFVTSDGKAPYNTAGRLVNGRIEGTTNSIGRGFLAVWTAEKVSAK